MGSLAIERLDAPAAELAARSRAWAATGAAARLTIGEPSDEGVVLGAFQRSSELGASLDGAPALFRRGSGGGAARVGPGRVWLQLTLGRPDALVPCTPDKLLNRYVRPLLRALTRATNAPASWFGRDWISAAHRPIALVAFAHDAAANCALFEAIVAVNAPFACGDRPSFLGKAPATLGEIAGRTVDPRRVVELAVEAYAGIATSTVAPAPASTPAARSDEPWTELPWAATRAEAIGLVGAGRDGAGRLCVGGELMASRDALARLEDVVSALPPTASEDEIGRAVDAALTTGGAVTFGVRSLASLRDVIVDALRAAQNIA
ncbi:MAG: hypothetical protein KF764_11190 [Labilithrix sp.]|nr:hypothetical protein [Labilithrix sp.]